MTNEQVNQAARDQLRARVNAWLRSQGRPELQPAEEPQPADVAPATLAP